MSIMHRAMRSVFMTLLTILLCVGVLFPTGVSGDFTQGRYHAKKRAQQQDGGDVTTAVIRAKMGCRFLSMTRLYRFSRFEVGQGYWMGVFFERVPKDDPDFDERSVRLEITSGSTGRKIVDMDLRRYSVDEIRALLVSHGYGFQDPANLVKSPAEYDARHKISSVKPDPEALLLFHEEIDGYQRGPNDKPDICGGPVDEAQEFYKSRLLADQKEFEHFQIVQDAMKNGWTPNEGEWLIDEGMKVHKGQKKKPRTKPGEQHHYDAKLEAEQKRKEKYGHGPSRASGSIRDAPRPGSDRKREEL